MWTLATPVLVMQILALLAGGAYELQRPPMTELQRFVRWQNPSETDLWVHWQQRGAFAGREGDTRIGRDLLLFRDSLRNALVETGRMPPQEFEARYGAAGAPRFCALAKDAIAATFAARYGGSPAGYDVSKYSRCAA